MHGIAGARDYHIGCNLREGYKDEGTLGQAWVGNFKAGLVKDLVAVEEDVEVEGAWTVGNLSGAVASEFALDAEKPIEQIVRAERGFEGKGRVKKAGLVGEADGSGGVEGRTRDDAAHGGEAVGSSGEGSFRRASGAGDVGAESYVSGEHGGQEFPGGASSSQSPVTPPPRIAPSCFGIRGDWSGK